MTSLEMLRTNDSANPARLASKVVDLINTTADKSAAKALSSENRTLSQRLAPL